MSASVWFNGRLVKDASLSLDPSDRGLLLGDGVFETIAVFNAKAIWLDDHLQRLRGAAAALGLTADRTNIEAAVKDLLGQAQDRHGIMRITLTRGPGVRGLAAEGSRPSLLATLSPWVRDSVFAPASLVTSSVRRNETSPASRLKTLSYIDNILAAREASSKRCDDALLLNTRGNVASTTIANLFILRGGRLSTPPLSAGILPGIARKKLMAFAKGEERELTPADLKDADAVFLTNSLRLIRPVHSLDGTTLRRNDVALTGYLDQLCKLIAEESGIDPRKADAL
jgi:branched-chain amino acid aminotransferase